MKKLLKALVVSICLTLTSCSNLFPSPVSRKPRSSSDEEISEPTSSRSNNGRSSSNSSSSSVSSSSSSSSTNYHFGSSNENPSGYVGQTTTVSFYLYDDEGNHPNLSPSSCSVQCMDNGLQAGYRVNGTVLDVDLTGLEPGSHRFKVTLKTTKGTSHTKNFYYDAIENANDPSSFYVDYQNNIEIWNGSLNEVPFRIINRY